MIKVRPPAVAGAFYPGDRDRLAATLDRLLADAPPSPRKVPQALVVPHAGYIYSGPIAASAYARLRGAASQLRRVVLLGPSHRVRLRGLALPDTDGLATPLGVLPVDSEGAAAVARLPQVSSSALAHAQEHSLEVQFPFLQRVLPGVPVVPLVVGAASAEQVAEVLEQLWAQEGTLVLISSDLSHYLTYEEAREVDRETADRILALGAEQVDTDQACGAIPLSGLLLAALRRGLRAEELDLRNSGDTAGDRSRVVGYGAFAFDLPQETV
ncbi:AmmeMemoRadiSam system protein B [Hyalangium minutum]|uniref:MEMO1 family protein DB31_0405 n=1 Tax=Hyalangium minutum TaxID=394096 RepID=A0A085WWT1_9BACT|nr:AmmeMemoRadiSam system protein B [Hyalangium minutum]KFE72144.1 putative dioxygenase [Hyalangium minutum]